MFNLRKVYQNGLAISENFGCFRAVDNFEVLETCRYLACVHKSLIIKRMGKVHPSLTR
jgi:hypothetical protein